MIVNKKYNADTQTGGSRGAYSRKIYYERKMTYDEN